MSNQALAKHLPKTGLEGLKQHRRNDLQAGFMVF